MAFVPVVSPVATPRRTRTTPLCTYTPPVATPAVAPVRAAAIEAPVKVSNVDLLNRMFAMPSAEASETGNETKLDRGKKAKVLLFNDASNERTYVARVICAVCPEISADQAWKIMMHAHKHGSATVGVYPFEQGELICEQLRNNGLSCDICEA
jgi:ATP-dependent Clp protease adapter protein ClpS